MNSKSQIAQKIKSLAVKRREESKHSLHESEDEEFNNQISQDRNEFSQSNFGNSMGDQSRYQDEDMSMGGDRAEENEEDENYLQAVRLPYLRKYKDGLKDFKSRRAAKYVEGKVDLGVLYLQELVYCLYEEDLITKDLMLAIRHFSIFATLDFIKKYQTQNLVDFDFETQKFALVDHRRICNLLIAKNPSKYFQVQLVYCMPLESYIFLNQIYSMPEEKYNQIITEIDKRFERLWWDSILSGKKGVYEVTVKPIVAQAFQEEKNKLQDKIPRKRQPIKKHEEQKEQGKRKNVHLESQFSSSVFESQMAQESLQISLGKDSHSISDLSDLFSNSDSQAPKKKPKKQRKLEKKAEKQMENKRQNKNSYFSEPSSFSQPDFSD